MIYWISGTEAFKCYDCDGDCDYRGPYGIEADDCGQCVMAKYQKDQETGKA